LPGSVRVLRRNADSGAPGDQLSGKGAEALVAVLIELPMLWSSSVVSQKFGPEVNPPPIRLSTLTVVPSGA
jgi:hypothetical protein